MRIFIAVDPPIGLSEELAAWARRQRAGGGFRLVAPESIHLTVVFLGEKPTSEVDQVIAAMHATPFEPILLALGAPMLLPPKTPRNFAIGVDDPSGGLRRLRDELASALQQAETRKFRPHLTLARMQRDGKIKPKVEPPPRAEFTASQMTLYRSHLEPTGARYEALETV